jgi:hypothetical protein
MWKNAFLLLILVGFSVGCGASPSVTPTQPAPPATNNIITPINPTPTVTPVSTDSSFTELNLAHKNVQAFSERLDFHLLVKISEERMGVFDLSKMEIQNEQPFPDSGISFPVVSDDGMLFAQIIFQGDEKILLVKNIPTNEEISVVLPNEATLPKWLDNEKLTVWGGSSHVQCERLLLTYDTSTAEVLYTGYPMPDLQTQECLRLPFLTADGTKMIYPWQMFDFTTGTSMDVFSFMQNVPEYPPAYSLKEGNGNISIVYVNGDTLKYLLNIPLAEINKADLTPERVLLPGLGTKDGWWQPFTWVPSKMQIGIDLIDQDTDLGELIASHQQVPTKFYLIDLSVHKIFYYELDRAVFVEGSLPQSVRNGFSSPDGAYFAWTIFDSSNARPVGSKVLELSSGHILSIPETEILGWVIPKTE